MFTSVYIYIVYISAYIYFYVYLYTAVYLCQNTLEKEIVNLSWAFLVK